MGRPNKLIAESEPAARLRLARQARGFTEASAAARYFGWSVTTYGQHERGERGLTRVARRYAAALGVSEAWLLTGEGLRESARAPILGRIGAGARVTFDDDEAERALGEWVDLPDAAQCWAFVVEGDSMIPRFYPGEVVLFRKQPAPLADLVGQYCLVQIEDSGDRLVKILSRGLRENRWRLDSHNARPIEDVALLAAHPWESTQRPRDGRITRAEPPKKPRR